MKVKNVICLLLLLVFRNDDILYAQPVRNSKGHYRNEMIRLQQAIETSFYDASSGFYKETVPVEKGKNTYSYLWPLCGMIQANNEIEKATREKGLVEKVMTVIGNYYDTAAPAPGYASYIMKFGGGDRFYDDNQWIGIAAMDAYSRLKKAACLNTAKEIYRYMMTGWDTVLSGGIYWQENKKISKNNCSNGPGIVLALQLYQATKEKSYLDTALMLYHWANKTLRAPSGLYWDNISVATQKVDRRRYSYNSGTMLQSNVYLYEITKDDTYLKEAVSIAGSALDFFYKDGTFKDNYWFNAVLLRGFQHLLRHHDNLKYIRAFKACVDDALQHNRNAAGLMGNEKTFDLVQQSGMLEILARFAYLETKYKL